MDKEMSNITLLDVSYQSSESSSECVTWLVHFVDISFVNYFFSAIGSVMHNINQTMAAICELLMAYVFRESYFE